MKIRILSAAENDIEEGYHFYESQDPGLGPYFLDTLYSDIDSLAYFGGMHRVVMGHHRMRQEAFIVTGALVVIVIIKAMEN